MTAAELSSLAIVTGAVLYLVAMAAHAWEWASAGAARVEEGATSPRLREEQGFRTGLALTLVALVVHVVGVVARGVAAHRLPWGTMYEFIISTMLAVVAAYLVAVWRGNARWLGLFVTLLASVGLGLAATVFYVKVGPLVPALHSVWFVIHIIAAVIAAAGFNLSALAGIGQLLPSRAESRGEVRGYLTRLPSATALDRLSYRLIAFTFPLWTFTIVAGSIWAQYAWGRYWGWDPKETFSFVTWVVYAAYLHARSTAGWAKAATWIGLVGVATFWFSFVGINLITSGLHSYGK